MARLAFNAYERPSGIIGVGSNGSSTVTFFDETFVKETASSGRGGLLEVRLKPSNVRPKTTDLHAKLILELNSVRVGTQGDTVHVKVLGPGGGSATAEKAAASGRQTTPGDGAPKLMQFFVKDDASDTLRVELHGNTPANKLGSLTLQLGVEAGIPRLPDENFKTITMRLEAADGRPGVTGEVRVQCRMRPFNLCKDAAFRQERHEPSRKNYFASFWDWLTGSVDDVADNQNQRGRPAAAAAGPWEELCRTVHGAADLGLVPVAFVECTETDTQVWLHRNKDSKKVVVAFRGTEPLKLKDWEIDIQAALVSDSELAPEHKNHPPAKLENGGFEVLVHKGFLRAYMSVRGTVRSLVNAMTAGPDQQHYTITFTGHSLGGALATLASYDMAARKWEDSDQKDERQQQPGTATSLVKAYTYGSPRVGSSHFMCLYNALVPDAWRVSNAQDLVARVPDRWLKEGASDEYVYYHVGKHWELGPQGPAPKAVRHGKEADSDESKRTGWDSLRKMSFYIRFMGTVVAHLGSHYLASIKTAVTLALSQQS